MLLQVTGVKRSAFIGHGPAVSIYNILDRQACPDPLPPRRASDPAPDFVVGDPNQNDRRAASVNVRPGAQLAGCPNVAPEASVYPLMPFGTP
jgi:hypothetical protein